jgi:hypothetical protein
MQFGILLLWKIFAPRLAQVGVIGGSGEIRTHERVTPLPVFKTGAFNRSATLPEGRMIYEARFSAKSWYCAARLVSEVIAALFAAVIYPPRYHRQEQEAAGHEQENQVGTQAGQ